MTVADSSTNSIKRLPWLPVLIFTAIIVFRILWSLRDLVVTSRYLNKFKIPWLLPDPPDQFNKLHYDISLPYQTSRSNFHIHIFHCQFHLLTILSPMYSHFFLQIRQKLLLKIDLLFFRGPWVSAGLWYKPLLTLLTPEAPYSYFHKLFNFNSRQPK